MKDQPTGNYGVALYYPHIHIGSDAWLKNTLLLWDCVRRIVPLGMRPGEDAGDTWKLAQAGLLLDTSPFDYTADAERIFFEKLEMRDVRGGSIRDALRRGSQHGPDDGFTSAEEIHVEKVSHHVISRMQKCGLADAPEGEWVRFDLAAGSLYMCCLATAMASSMAAPLITEHSPYLGWSHLFSKSRPLARDTVATALAELQIDWPFPSEIAEVPTEKFLKFHSQRAPERRAFREALQGIIADLDKITDGNQFADALAKHRRDIEARMKDLRQSQSEIGITRFVSALKISSPTMIAGLAAAPFVGHVAASVITGVGAALGCASWVAEVRGARRSFRERDPLYYALAVQSKF
jgi:hypothetical protein